MMAKFRHHWLSIASIVCFLHCICLPVLVSFYPAYGHFFHHTGLELGLLIFSILCGALVIRNGYMQHRHMWTLIFFFMGAIFWFLHLVFEYYHLSYEMIPLYVGTIFIVISYISNFYRMTNHCHMCNHS